MDSQDGRLTSCKSIFPTALSRISGQACKTCKRVVRMAALTFSETPCAKKLSSTDSKARKRGQTPNTLHSKAIFPAQTSHGKNKKHNYKLERTQTKYELRK